LSQRKYLTDLLKEAGALGSQPIDTPMNPNIRFDQNLRELLADPRMYRRLIGKLIYLTVHLILHLLWVLSQYMQSPYQPH